MIIVTGGAGFIGSVLISELNKKGIKDIIVVDRLGKTEKWKNLLDLKFEEYIHSDDIFNEENEELLEEAEFIFHMGACSSTTEMDMDFLIENNLNFSKKIFAIATQLGTPIIYASSAATYGAGDNGYGDDHGELKNLRALNPYGYSKQLFDEWVVELDAFPPKWFGLKFFNVYGPNESHKGEMRSIVHKAFGQIKKAGKVKLFKSHKEDFQDGEQLRDFIYVKDVVKAMLEMMEIKKGSGIYNMGTGKARSFNDLVKQTFKSLDREENIEYIDMPDSIRNQYQYYTQAEMKKFNKLLPNFKFSSLEEGVDDYVKNHLNQ